MEVDGYMTPSVEKMQVPKLEAAKRQLHAAIRLWFAEEDPVSIHTLVSAAHEIIHTLFKRKGLKGLLFDNPSIPDSIRTDFGRAVKSAANAFKHARDDPDGVTEFSPEFNAILFWICITGLWRMGEPFALEEAAAIFWFLLHRPDWLADVFYIAVPDSKDAGELREIPKNAFLKDYSQLWRDGDLAGGLAKIRTAILAAESAS